MSSWCFLDVLRMFAGFFQDVFRMPRWVLWAWWNLMIISNESTDFNDPKEFNDQGHPNLCAEYVSWKPNQMAVYVDLQAELTIVSTSQTKHLILSFQYEFDIQYSRTPGGQCWGSDPKCRGRWKDWYYHDTHHETLLAMDKKSKRVKVGLCQYMEPLGPPNPDILFYKISNDVPVHRLFLDLRCGEKSMPTHPVSSIWHASSRYTDVNKSSISRLFFSSKSHTNPVTRILPSYYVLTDQGGELSCIREGFLFYF